MVPKAGGVAREWAQRLLQRDAAVETSFIFFLVLSRRRVEFLLFFDENSNFNQWDTKQHLRMCRRGSCIYDTGSLQRMGTTELYYELTGLQ